MIKKEFLNFTSIASVLLIIISAVTLFTVTGNQPNLSPTSTEVNSGAITIILIALLVISIMILMISLVKSKKR